MKRRMLVMLFAIVSATILFLIGYAILIPCKQNTTALSPIENAEAIYSNAVSKTVLSKDTILTIKLTEEMTLDGSVFLEVSDRIVYYDTDTPNAPHIQMHETRRSGSHIIEISEIHVDDTIYLSVNDTPFISTCNAAQYQMSQIPAIIISQELYRNIKGIDTGDKYMITFTEPISTETWLAGDYVVPLDAHGTAYVGYDGNLESSTYSTSYQRDGVTFRITADVSIMQESVNITPPEDTSAHTMIDDWQAPKQLERACGFLIQAKQISTVYNDSIYFDAIGDRRETNIALHAIFDRDWSVAVTTDITTSNETKQDQSQTLTKNELFVNGQYQISTNNETRVTNSSITVDTVYNYFQDQLVSTIMLPQHIHTADVTENGDTLRFLFTGTDAFGYFLAENACQLLYNDPSLITQAGSGFSAIDLKCYLEINKATGLPLASGIDFTGNFKTDGIPYSLKYSADQTYFISNPDTQVEIQNAAD